jgi:tRNA 2-thiouridine synthesizing protein E
MNIQVNGQNIPLDAEGYLNDPEDWNEAVCAALADANGVQLDDCRWKVIHVMRDFYQEYQAAPGVPGLRKALERENLNCDTKFLKSLFSTNKVCEQVCRLAGLPKPFCSGC